MNENPSDLHRRASCPCIGFSLNQRFDSRLYPMQECETNGTAQEEVSVLAQNQFVTGSSSVIMDLGLYLKPGISDTCNLRESDFIMRKMSCGSFASFRNRWPAALIAAGVTAGSAHAGVIELGFELETYGMTSGGVETEMGSGDFGVIDLWATSSNASSIRLLNVFNVSVSLSRGGFVHNDASTSGRWEASFSRNSLGATNAIDSFVTMGASDGDDPFVAYLDPSFDGMVGDQVSDRAGWYNPDPTNDQGLLDSRIFLGWFVIDQADVAGNTFSFTGSLGWKFDAPDQIVQQSSNVVSRAFPGAVVPGPIAGSVLGALFLVRRRRR